MSELANLTASIQELTHELRAHTIHHATERILDRIQQLENKIMASQAEIVAQLKTATAQIAEIGTGVTDIGTAVDKIGTETDKSLQLIKDLQTAVDNQTNATPELIDATNALASQVGVVSTAVTGAKAKVQAVDDKIPDAVPPTP
jgi:chromosome segregation ATPase